LLHYAKAAYHYLADKGEKLYAKMQNYINEKPNEILAQNK
jgi:hypothetical protein